MTDDDQWEYAAIELRPDPFHDDPDSYYWSEPQWWHPTEQEALDDLETEFMEWGYGTSAIAYIIRRPKPHAPEVVRTLHSNPHRKEKEPPPHVLHRSIGLWQQLPATWEEA